VIRFSFFAHFSLVFTIRRAPVLLAAQAEMVVPELPPAKATVKPVTASASTASARAVAGEKSGRRSQVSMWALSSGTGSLRP
jgi:hypothetical protein